MSSCGIAIRSVWAPPQRRFGSTVNTCNARLHSHQTNAFSGIQQVPFSGSETVQVGVGKESRKWHHPPRVPTWDEERSATVEHEGLPSLEGKKLNGTILFKNVKDLWIRDHNGLRKALSSGYVNGDEPTPEVKQTKLASVVVQDGKIVCMKSEPRECAISGSSVTTTIDLRGGSIIPALMSYGSPLGLEEIAGEPSTGDGRFWNTFRADLPKITGDVGGVVRASDALQFSTRHALCVNYLVWSHK